MASRSLNRVILLGNLTRDPELKYTPAGTAVCTFGIATNRSWTTADGQIKEDVQYHRIVAWQKLAELCGKLLTKGRKVYLEGRLTYRTFTGKDTVQRTVAEIVLDDFIVFGDGAKSGSYEAKTDVPTEKDTEEAYTMTDDDNASEHPAAESSNRNQTMSQDVNPEDIPF